MLFNLFIGSFIVGPTSADAFKSVYMAIMGIMDCGEFYSQGIRNGKAEVSPTKAIMYATGNVLVRDVARRIGEKFLFNETVLGTAGTVVFICGVGTIGGLCLNKLMGKVSKNNCMQIGEFSFITSSMSAILFFMVSASIANEEAKINFQSRAIY